jgi:hypothetical protein
VNLCRPLHKAKYSFTPIANSTARERLKEPREGSEIDPETLNLQRVGALRGDCVPIDEWASELLVVARLRQIQSEPERKRV